MKNAGQNIGASARGSDDSGQPVPNPDSDRDDAVARGVRASLAAVESIWADDGSAGESLSPSSASMLGLPVLDEPVLTGPFGGFQINRCLGRTRRHGTYLATDSQGEKP